MFNPCLFKSVNAELTEHEEPLYMSRKTAERTYRGEGTWLSTVVENAGLRDRGWRQRSPHGRPDGCKANGLRKNSQVAPEH